jgi:hypothetical protein
MRRVDRGLLLAARGLGATPWKIFQRIYLPLTLPGVLAGMTLVSSCRSVLHHARASRRRSRAHDRVLIEKQVREFLDWGFAAALSIGAARRSAARVRGFRNCSRATCDGVEGRAAACDARRSSSRRRLTVLRARCSVPDAAAVHRLPDLVQLRVVSAVPAAGILAALVRVVRQTIQSGWTQRCAA